MFQVEALETPEAKAIPGGSITLTHRCRTLVVDSRRTKPAQVRVMKGFMNGDVFQDWGEAELDEQLTAEEYAALLADTTGGKPAGMFRADDMLKAAESKKEARVAKEVADKNTAEAPKGKGGKA